MLRHLLHRTIRRMERRFRYDAAYMHDLIDTSPAAMLKLALVQGINTHCQGVPRPVWHAARIVAARHEDCGPCTQLVVDMALADGMEPHQVRAVVARDFAAMNTDVALGVRLAEAVAGATAADQVRAEILARFGEAGLTSLALGIASARIFPTLKQTLGHAQSCARLNVRGEIVHMVGREHAA
ncbi:MAG: hypothetical protein U5Q16_10545 [Gammaproteobacteria bacterium]|nr:hypothetical protein [Gammaproteobacteria bacterium]